MSEEPPSEEPVATPEREAPATPPASRGVRILRLMGLPVLVAYVLALVFGSLPAKLLVGPLAHVQLAASLALAQLGWPAGLSVFTGQGDPELGRVQTCVRLVGLGNDGSEATLFDNFADCRDDRRAFLKDPYATYLVRELDRGLVALASGEVEGDLNRYPLSQLFALLDHYCFDRGAEYGAIGVSIRRQALRFSDGAPAPDTRERGLHLCRERAWRVVPLPGSAP